VTFVPIYIVWAVSFGVIIYRMFRGRPTGGLLLCFWVNMAMNHFIAHLCWDITPVYLTDKYDSDQGFLLTGNAMAGLLIGIVLCGLVPLKERPSVTTGMTLMTPTGQNRFAGWAVGFGTVLWLLGFTGVYGLIPSLTAVTSSAAAVVIGGLCLKFWALRRLGRTKSSWRWAAVILMYPLITVLGSGFLGFGVSGVIVVACFVLPYLRFRWIGVILTPFVCYVGLSLWVTYAAAREEIRNQVWGNKAYADRIDAAYTGMIVEWSWFDITDQSQISRLERLNQNILVGQMVQYREQTSTKLEYGDMFTNAASALVPRILWPNKPFYAGSGKLASQYTGREFAEGTSVGIGYIMEFYVNFGAWVVTVGFILLGFTIALLDRWAAMALSSGQSNKYLYSFAICLPMMNTLGYLAELAPSIVGGVIYVYLLVNFILPRFNSQKSFNRVAIG